MKDRAREKWRSSGLTDDQAKKLNLKPLEGKETKKLDQSFHPVGALQIPYFDLDGKTTDFFRLRYLEPLPGFAGAVEKPQRYVQKPGTINEVYYPPLLDSTWRAVAENSDVKLVITEGEFKAAAACSAGIPCIGLGGVDVWRSTKRGIGMLSGLEAVKWTARGVTIMFDSDAQHNPNVVRAQLQLARALLDKGARVRVASLPPAVDGSKQGLDDFLVAQGVDALKQAIDAALPYQTGEALWRMNEELIFVKDPGMVIARETGQRMEPGRFTNAIYANRHHVEITTDANGNTKARRVPTAKAWLEWPSRSEVDVVTYAPGKPRVDDGSWNLWAGWGCDPEPGDVGPWHALLDVIFGKDDAARQWFEAWCAYPLQHPGVKLYTAPLIWGAMKGTGKTLIAYSLMKIYGANSTEIKSKDLRGGFNSWADRKQFVYGDEITGGQARVDSDWLKGLITQHVVRINAKYQPEFEIPDCMNYLFTSNHPDALFLEDHDRRFFVHEVLAPPQSREFYEVIDRWLHGKGPPALFAYLLDKKIDFFNPRERAPDSESKMQMMINGKSDLAVWVMQLKEDPDRLLAALGERQARECALYTPTQLLHAYDPEGKLRVTAGGVARELARQGIRQINGASPVRTACGVVRLYAVRDQAKWLNATIDESVKHFNRYFGVPQAKHKG